MRPHRLQRYQQNSRQGQQEEENHDQLNYYGYSQTWGENNLASAPSPRFTRGWYHDSQGNSEWQRQQQHRSGRHVTDINSGYGNSSSGWTAYHDYDDFRQWHIAHDAREYDYRDNFVSPFHNNRYNAANQYHVELSGDRHYFGTRSHYRYISSRAHNYRQQARSHHSSAVTLNPSAVSTDAANDAVVGETSTEGFPNPVVRSRDNQKSPRRVYPLHIPMKRKLGPSGEYLKISAEKSETLGGATRAGVDVEGLVRKLLVLDLNGTLVYRSPYRSWRDRHPGRGGSVAATTEEDVYAQFNPSQPRPLRTAHPRPYLTPFRNYLFHPSTKRWLDTMVWSSAQPHSVDDMVEKCFGDKKGELVAIWARDRLGLAAGDYSRKVQTTKDLNKPWNELNSIPLVVEDSSEGSESTESIPLQRNHSAKTTLLLDDSPLKAHLQPYNHLCLKEYDLQMRKHDMSVQELEVAREQLADVLSGKQTIEEVLDKNKVEDDHDLAKEPPQKDLASSAGVNGTPELVPEAGDGNARKRKKKEKKENKKKERIEQQVQKLRGQDTLSYDETLLAVIGVLDATKRETNVAAWIRGGGLIQSLLERDHDEVGRASVESDEAVESSKKKRKVSKKGREGKQSPENEDNVSLAGSDQVPLPTSSPPRETSPPEEGDQGAGTETERTGVLVDEPSTENGVEGTKDVQNQLWFSYPGNEAFWALRGRKVLEELEIDIVTGLIAPTA